MSEHKNADKRKNEEFAASKEAALEAYDKLQEARLHFQQAAQAAGMDLKGDAIEQIHKGRDKVDELGAEASAFVRDKPLATLGIAFLVGYVLAQVTSRR